MVVLSRPSSALAYHTLALKELELKPDVGDIMLSVCPFSLASQLVHLETCEVVALKEGENWELVSLDNGLAMLQSDQRDEAEWCCDLLRKPLYQSSTGRACFFDCDMGVPTDMACPNWLDVEQNDWALRELRVCTGACAAQVTLTVEIKAPRWRS